MTELLWKIIDESKEGKPFIKSEEQYRNLSLILIRYEQDTIKNLSEVWNQLTSNLIKDKNDDYRAEYEKLHVQNGGIVDSGDDGFYMDFPNWVVAQGEGLYKEFFEKGHQAIMEYINEHDIDEDDYLYESMGYVFHEYIKE